MSIPNSKEQAADNKTNSNEQIANSKARYNNLNFALCSLLFVICFLAITGCGPDPFYIPTVFIEGVPETGTAGTPLALTATIRPVFASNKDIIWSVKNAGTTGTVISGNILKADADGTVVITARIPNGKAEGKDYTQDFIIVIGSGAPITDKDKKFTIEIHKSGDESDDALTASPDKGIEGVTVTLTYTVANTKHYNQLDFGGVSATIASVTEAGTGTRTYVINAADSADDVITITAIFEHTDLVIDHIAFSEHNEGHITKTYGDPAFTNAVTNAHKGSGAITYHSDTPTVATVDNSGQVTIHRHGSAVISAEKAADLVYAHAQTTYTLTVAPKPVTITGLSASDKQYDGTTTATVTGTTVISGLISGDDVTVIAGTASFESMAVGTNKFVTFSGYSLTGADMGNYSLSAQPATVTANITKASGASVTAPTVNGTPTSDTITVNAASLQTATGQSIEYAISTASNGTGLSAWQSGTTFSGLTANTTYFVYARSASNENYNEGVPNVSAGITTVESPTYGISLSTSGTYIFTAVEYGYGAQSPLTVTVTNTGNQATGALDIALSGANSGSFTLLKTSITTIATGGSDTFTVSPATGLDLETYTATVTISGGNGITASFGISFTVHDITAPTLTLDNIIRQSDTLAMVSFTTNEAGTAYYLVQNVGVAAPTSAQVKAGTSLGAVDYGANSNKAVTLTAGAKDIYVVVEDAAGNISEPLKIEAEAHVTIIRVDGTPIVGDLITIGTNDTVTLTTEKTYESYRWSVNGVAQTGETKTEYTFYASGRQVDKTYAIVVLVFKDGVPYSKAITIRIQS
ncbi:YDG domain-containing protein [Treponema sp. R80B11-R83G3]